MPLTNAGNKTAFGLLLEAKIAESKKTTREIAAQLKGTPASQFTRWKQGRWTYIDSDKLVALIEAIAPHNSDRCDLLIAYLHDLTPVKYRPMLQHARKGDIPRSITDGDAPWRDPMRQRLDIVAEAYERNDDYAALVDHLVSWGKRLTKEE